MGGDYTLIKRTGSGRYNIRMVELGPGSQRVYQQPGLREGSGRRENTARVLRNIMKMYDHLLYVGYGKL